VLLKTYAIQAGRELTGYRWFRENEVIRRQNSFHTIYAKRIQDEMTYPGQIKDYCNQGNQSS
jgi:hypothetical protein